MPNYRYFQYRLSESEWYCSKYRKNHTKHSSSTSACTKFNAGHRTFQIFDIDLDFWQLHIIQVLSEIYADGLSIWRPHCGRPTTRLFTVTLPLLQNSLTSDQRYKPLYRVNLWGKPFPLNIYLSRETRYISTQLLLSIFSVLNHILIFFYISDTKPFIYVHLLYFSISVTLRLHCVVVQ